MYPIVLTQIWMHKHCQKRPKCSKRKKDTVSEASTTPLIPIREIHLVTLLLYVDVYLDAEPSLIGLYKNLGFSKLFT